MCLFTVQKWGTHRISFAFSPVVTLWMLSLLGVGAYNLATYGGGIFQALDPRHIVTLYSERGALAWEALGGVMLTLTGKGSGNCVVSRGSRSSIILYTALLVLLWLTGERRLSGKSVTLTG